LAQKKIKALRRHPEKSWICFRSFYLLRVKHYPLDKAFAPPEFGVNCLPGRPCKLSKDSNSNPKNLRPLTISFLLKNFGKKAENKNLHVELKVFG